MCQTLGSWIIKKTQLFKMMFTIGLKHIQYNFPEKQVQASFPVHVELKLALICWAPSGIPIQQYDAYKPEHMMPATD